MRVLVTYGSKRGGTEGIARMIADELEAENVDVDVLPGGEVGSVQGYDAFVVGGGLYANRWQRGARRFVKQHADVLRTHPVWFFSSGPLDDSASEHEIPPPAQVQALMDRVGVREHITFGGRLEPEAKGFLASRMAKTHAGDWRDPQRVKAWAHRIAQALTPRAPLHEEPVHVSP